MKQSPHHLPLIFLLLAAALLGFVARPTAASPVRMGASSSRIALAWQDTGSNYSVRDIEGSL